MDLVTPDFGLVFWTALTFLFLLLTLRKFAWKPILGAVSDREEGIKEALASADIARLEMQNLKADNERILKEARAEREVLLKEAREIKTKIIDDAVGEAQNQASKLIEQTKIAISNEKEAALIGLKQEMGKLSVGITEKVVKNQLIDKEKQLQLIEELLEEVTLN